ncbi:MAG: HNH endonuclease [Pyrinomonadaceae bacterium]|nr:HNH endonuclease [Pyrinomonadaceae bacterium]
MSRRARKLNAPVIIPFTKREIINRDGLNCYICKTLLTERTATIDHVIPLSRGGFHCPNNAKIACLKCNQEKSNKYENY